MDSQARQTGGEKGDIVQVQAAAKTDVGRVRERNEDAFLIDQERHLYAVADGMGGHAGGQRASHLAVEVLSRHITERADDLAGACDPAHTADSGEVVATPPCAEMLIAAVRSACAEIYDTAAREPELMGMGTTTTVLLVRPGWAYVAHVGDSRCYVQRDGKTQQVTEDHSLVNEQVKAGLLTPEAALASRHKNIITRSVGFERDVAVDTYLLPTEPGDLFLLCSDGLSNLIAKEELGQAMVSLRGQPLLDYLVNLALERGGDDNITVLTVELSDGQPGQRNTLAPLTLLEGDTPPHGTLSPILPKGAKPS